MISPTCLLRSSVRMTIWSLIRTVAPPSRRLPLASPLVTRKMYGSSGLASENVSVKVWGGPAFRTYVLGPEPVP
jgi:hypothetical protein